ncbi:MAG TPA: hypothetical protein VLH13_04860, partial [Methanomassiliicoccales archaeon]|nr:hypothetical protein [Methanomassiliicoccales archaeon]
MTGTPVPKAHAPIEAPKGMAVFLCRCNGAVSSVIDLEVLRAMADSDPNVRSVDVMQCCCGEEDKDRVRLALRSDDLDRFLVAGCSFRSMGERFRSLAVESGINASMLEMCNLKEQCAAVHRGVPAQRKAERLF